MQPTSNRNSSGMIISTTGIVANVRSQIGTVLDSTTTNALTVAVAQTTASGTNVVTVTVSGTVPYMFNLWGSTFSVNRGVTFRDEGR